MNAKRTSRAMVAALMLAACTAGATTTPTSAPTGTAPGTSAAPSIAATSAPSPTAVATRAPIPYLPALATGALAAGTAADLQKVLDGLVTGGAPDAIGSVITADGQWSGAAGIDGPGGRAADPADEFNIASVSKTILAALVLRLAQDGKMDLDAPVSSYLGDLPINANGATVRQALAMRSGIRDTPGSLLAEASAHCDRVWTRADLLPSIPAPSGAADSAFYYSNPTYKMLGYVAEQVTGQRLETALAEQMFTSLGEDRILLQGPDRATPKPWALPIAGHGGSLDLATYGTGGTLPCISLSTFSFANSAIASDAPSLARWGWGLFSGTLLDQDSLSAMTAVGAEGYGLGIERLPDFVPDVAYGVHGSQAGYAAFLVIVPWRQAVAVLFINDENANVQGGARSLIRALRP